MKNKYYMEELNRKNIKTYYRKSGIYYFTVGRHSYVGSSVNVGSRLSNHIWAMQSGKHRNRIIQNCYNKYSISGFSFKILEFCDKDKRIEREKYYIDLLHPDLNVANPVTLVRDKPEYIERQRAIRKEYYKTHESASKIPVYQYAKTGEYITSFSSITEAANFYNVNNTAISFAARKPGAVSVGFQWRKEKYASIPSCIKVKVKKEKPKRTPKPGNKKRIYRYSLDGIYIDSFESASLANRTLNIHGCQAAAIGKGPYRSAGGFLWSYEKVDKMKPYENHSKDSKIKNIYLFDCISGVEKEYRSIADAAKDIIKRESFDSLCSNISCSARMPSFVQNRYLARYEGDIYRVGSRNTTWIDNENNIYKKKKEIPKGTEVIALITCAHNKLRESGKLFK